MEDNCKDPSSELFPNEICCSCKKIVHVTCHVHDTKLNEFTCRKCVLIARMMIQVHRKVDAFYSQTNPITIVDSDDSDEPQNDNSEENIRKNLLVHPS